MSMEVESVQINVGTKNDPFFNSAIVANDEESTVVVRYPEQDLSGATFSAFLTVTTDSGLFSVDESEVTCTK